MTTKKFIKIIGMLTLIIWFQVAKSQDLPDNATIKDISNLKDDIANRTKNIANSESEISEERRWLSSIKGSVLKLKNSYSETDEQTDIDKFKNDLLALVDKLSKIDCNNILECKSQIESVLTEFSVLSDNDDIIDIFDRKQDWIKFSNKFRKLNQYFPSNSRPTPVPFDAAECSKVKNIFSSEEIKSELNNFVEIRKKEIDKFSKEKIDKLAMLDLVEKEINSYNQKLNEAWQKANTKMSLQTNLYLMILIIGLLSIATIGIVRWFPEAVMSEWVESGQVIQFVTVMILLSVIMSLGLAGLLGENTLGTLLGGIGGYVLSQGVGRAAARAALKDFKSNTEPDKVEKPIDTSKKQDDKPGEQGR